jgi:hypothetical protein
MVHAVCSQSFHPHHLFARANMHELPGTIPPEVARSHPRRAPANKSVSLRHSPPAKAAVTRSSTALSSPNPASDLANPPTISPQLLSHKYSSGESSDAGRWFEKTNNDVRQAGDSSNDSEPPFFLRNSSSADTPPEGPSTRHVPKQSAVAYRPGTALFAVDGNNMDDFRSVIDDLTVANKKLKQKLKKYERVQDAHKEEKLFEVRFHGLPEHKKKELAETLRKFAAELDDGSTAGYAPGLSYAPAFEHHKSASSTSHFAESGYASMSMSGQNSVTPTNQSSLQTDKSRKQSRSVYNQQQQSIQSYLHDIPAGSNVQGNVPMTDKSKKKLVVRRLEQIFAGKRSVPGVHPQPMQQEEVAQSAATADRQEREATGQYRKPEGSRVARLQPESSREGYFLHGGESSQNLHPLSHLGEPDPTGETSPDQRPTRPLDLDPSRAQLPDENMDYIRHLGFTPPNMETGVALQDGHGWLYLNLLMNMAQLHTLHVTSEFVKDALLDYSNYLELSRDGRKVRWSGGLDITRNGCDSPSELESRNSPNEQSLSSKFLKTGDSATSNEARLDPEQRARLAARAKREEELSKFTYKPLFYRKESSEEEEGSYDVDVESSDPSLQPAQHTTNSSGVGNSALRSGASSGARREDGPMIFYSKAKFCTDLSGDRLTRAVIASDAYKTVTSHPLGATSTSYGSADRATGLTEPRGPMDASPMDIDSNHGSRTVMSGSDIEFSPAMLRGESSGSDSPAEVIDFDVSGLGGVRSLDNFAIRVRRSQIQTAPSGTTARRRPSLYSSRIRQALNLPSSPKDKTLSPKPLRIIKQQLLSASRKLLPNSTLPPPSFMPFDSTSSADAEENSESLASSEDSSASGDGPATTFQRHFAASQTDSDEASEYSDDSDDGSVDFLATARQLDPKTIRNQEREYDAALADRLAEEIVAGSSAATAGGGSGFNTPSGDVGDAGKTVKTPGGQGAARTPLKRARTSEGVPVMGEVKKSRTGN